jgi:predicted heme/steroid binding protein
MKMEREKYAFGTLMLIAVAAVVFVSGCTTTNNGTNLPPAPNGGTDNDGSDGSGNGGSPVIEPITLAQVAEHNTRDDCWMAIDGKVYDVTSFMTHPGGAAIAEGCGKDASSLFNQRTREDGSTVGSGTPHSSNARNLLPTYYIGDLA